jgi:hypothetical protein
VLELHSEKINWRNTDLWSSCYKLQLDFLSSAAAALEMSKLRAFAALGLCSCGEIKPYFRGKSQCQSAGCQNTEQQHRSTQGPRAIGRTGCTHPQQQYWP